VVRKIGQHVHQFVVGIDPRQVFSPGQGLGVVTACLLVLLTLLVLGNVVRRGEVVFVRLVIVHVLIVVTLGSFGLPLRL
jgi:hypothetical protein